MKMEQLDTHAGGSFFSPHFLRMSVQPRILLAACFVSLLSLGACGSSQSENADASSGTSTAGSANNTNEGQSMAGDGAMGGNGPTTGANNGTNAAGSSTAGTDSAGVTP